MNVLIAYATTEGHTREVVNRMTGMLTEAGHVVTRHDCGETGSGPDVSSFDAVLVAGSVHQEVHQPVLVEFVTNNLESLSSRPSAFVSVSLSAALESGKSTAQKYVDGFIQQTGWTPNHVHLAGGAIRFLEYDFFKRFTVEHIVLGGKKSMPDASSGNPEYTDWASLEEFVSAFSGEMAA